MVDNPVWEICERVAEVQALLHDHVEWRQALGRGRGGEGAGGPVGARAAPGDVRCRILPAQHAAPSSRARSKGRSVVNSLSDVFTFIGYIVVGSGIVGTPVWWLFRTFSEKWLSAKFAERLAAYKHEQQKELEHLKFAINAQMDRATKLHQKEFDALPEAWGRLMDAHGIIMSVVSRLQSTPDLNAMASDQLVLLS